jgi:DNA polymerase III subunit delta'
MRHGETAFPWHASTWAGLTRDPARLPHGLLLHGAAGLGKRELALRLAARLLCLAPADGDACGTCRSCELLLAGAHPDFVLVGPLEDSRFITVDQVRELAEFLALRPHTATRKAIVLHPADALNVNAANSLLKILEEPPLGSFLILVTDKPARLAATVRSRCTQIALPLPSRQQALAWLASGPDLGADPAVLLDLAGGAPLRAVEFARGGFLEQRRQLLDDVIALREQHGSPLTCAARWKTIGTRAALAWFHGMLADVVRVGVAGAAARLANPDLRSRLQELGKDLHLNKLYEFIDVVSESLQQLSGPLDELLVLEDILIRWNRLGRLSSTLK